MHFQQDQFSEPVVQPSQTFGSRARGVGPWLRRRGREPRVPAQLALPPAPAPEAPEAPEAAGEREERLLQERAGEPQRGSPRGPGKEEQDSACFFWAIFPKADVRDPKVKDLYHELVLPPGELVKKYVRCSKRDSGFSDRLRLIQWDSD